MAELHPEIQLTQVTPTPSIAELRLTSDVRISVWENAHINIALLSTNTMGHRQQI